MAGVTAFTQQTQIHALDPETGQRVWPGATPVASAQNNIAVAGRLVFVNTGTTGLVILDETTGAVLKTIVPPNAGPAVSGVTVAEGTVFWVSGGYLNAWRPTKPAS